MAQCLAVVPAGRLQLALAELLNEAEICGAVVHASVYSSSDSNVAAFCSACLSKHTLLTATLDTHASNWTGCTTLAVQPAGCPV
jgi:hypothetical protein